MTTTDPAQTFYERLALDHVDEMIAAISDPRVGTYIGGDAAVAPDAIRARIERVLEGPDVASEIWLNWAVRHDGVVIGWLQATIFQVDPSERWAEIAYVFGQPSWGKGLAAAGVRWLLATLDVPEAWAAVHPGNARSCALLERLGFARSAPTRTLPSYEPGDVTFVIRRAREN